MGRSGQKGSREEGQAGPWKRQDQKRHRWEGLGWLDCGQRRVKEETGGRGGWSGAGAGGRTALLEERASLENWEQEEEF